MEWRVYLSGDPADLAFLREGLPNPPLLVARDDRGYYLTSSEFAPMKPADVSTRAEELVARMSGLLRASRQSDRSLRLAAVERVRDDGGRDLFVFPKPAVIRIRLQGRLTALRDGVQASEPGPLLTQRIMAIADSDEDVARALRLLCDDPTWSALYRVLEIVEADCGPKPGVAKRRWASAEELRRFKHSANSVAVSGDEGRHGHDRQRPPRHPMSLSEAARLIHRVVQMWLNSLADARGL